jgi:dihydroorotase
MHITLTRPDDWHLHLRDGPVLSDLVRHSARQFGRAIIMPNLTPPVTRTKQAQAYRQRIIQALPSGLDFEPLMTLYLTDSLPPIEIDRGVDSGFIKAVKLYPAGATTNSEAGVSDLRKTYPVLERMQARDLPLLVHGEVVDPEVDIFDREKVFIDRQLKVIAHEFPALKLVFEHITTQEAVQFVLEGPPRLAATITPHHLLFNRNALLVGGIRPHHYCLPVLKRESHRQALLEAATSGHPKFFLGTDSAPHSRHTKERACGCAGIFSAHGALEFYAEAFEQAGHLERLEAFASFHGADFYGEPRNTTRVTLAKEIWTVPDNYAFGHNDRLVPLRAGQKLTWRLQYSGPQC